MLKKTKAFFSLLFIVLILVISSAVIVMSSIAAPQDQVAKTVKFTIPKGQTISQIGQRLEQEGLIRSQWAFRIWILKDHLQNKIQAGSFELSANMALSELVQQLTKGTDDVWVTLPEGWRREEMAESLAKQELNDFDQTEFLRLTEGMEGQLFPDTYLVSHDISTQAFVNLMQNTFESKVTTALAADLKASQMSLNEILTLASLVQRESAGDSEMPLVAGILQHRLQIGMPLQVDATLQYIRGNGQKNGEWWPTPFAADKELNSLYNTYTHAGLPPAPICNPGLAAIKAALHPTSTLDLYYLHDSQGQIHTAADLAGHNANINKYLQN